MKPRIHVYYKITEGPWGGGNTFLKALRGVWQSQGLYEDEPVKADIILFNSFDKLPEVLALRRRYPGKAFIHRVDGPISLVRGKDKLIDKQIFAANQAVADGTVFQTEWSRQSSKQLGFPQGRFEKVIINGSDESIFNEQGRVNGLPGDKIRLVAGAWSDNWKKGFGIYKYLDDNLNWSRFEMSFMGRSPVKFKNIKMLGSLSLPEEAEVLRRAGVFITASQDDPCSNSLIEALNCGVPAVALRSGGHPEIVGQGGELFDDEPSLMAAIEKVAAGAERYRKAITKRYIASIAREYYEFAEAAYDELVAGRLKAKKPSLADLVGLRLLELGQLLIRAQRKILK